MRIKTLSGVVANNQDIPAGKVVDLPDKVARFLIAIGKAVEATEDVIKKELKGKKLKNEN